MYFFHALPRAAHNRRVVSELEHNPIAALCTPNGVPVGQRVCFAALRARVARQRLGRRGSGHRRGRYIHFKITKCRAVRSDPCCTNKLFSTCATLVAPRRNTACTVHT